MGFLTRLIDDVAAENAIDTGRVYAVGVSAGAMMAYRLACEQARRIAGVGSVAGAMVLDGCHPARPVSVIEIHGTADGLVPYEGGRTREGRRNRRRQRQRSRNAGPSSTPVRRLRPRTPRGRCPRRRGPAAQQALG